MNSHGWLVAGLVVFVLSQPRLAQQKLSRMEMEEDVKEFFSLTRQHYSYIDEKKTLYGIDLDTMQTDALKRLDKVHSNADFYTLLQEVMAGLKDGHGAVRPSELVAPKPLPQSWPVLLQFVKEGVIITKSLAGPGISRGDLLKEVNDRPIEDWIKEAALTVFASTDGARRRLALHRVVLTVEETVKFRVVHPDGTDSVATVKTCPREKLSFPAVPNLPDLPKGKFIVSSVLKDDVGYIRITSLSWGIKTLPKEIPAINKTFKPAWDAIDAAFAAVVNTKALVLDLRGNTGGFDHLGGHIACHFIPGDFHYLTFHIRHTLDLHHWKPRQEPFWFYKGKVYACPVAVLIDEGSFSATDMLVAALKDLTCDFRFVGRPTHGGVGGPKEVGKLTHSQVAVVLCTMRHWSPKGRFIEGCGTSPDMPVSWTRQAVLKNVDADLEAALKVLRE
jgi:C-terminal processing protease CtpA/Prc